MAGRPALLDVVIGLKNKNVLKGGEVGTAQSYLKFRNDSLHADWKNVSRSQIESCLAFVESLISEAFQLRVSCETLAPMKPLLSETRGYKPEGPTEPWDEVRAGPVQSF